MRCPYCGDSAFEHQEECGSCSFSLTRASTYFGTVPQINTGVTDNLDLLSRSEFRKLVGRIKDFQRKFPQINLSVLTAQVPAEMPLSVYAFWIFNLAGISADLNRGGDNHDILITLDKAKEGANIIVGYGLEPFIGSERLDAVMTSAQPFLADAAYAKGLHTIIDNLADSLATVCTGMSKTYGVDLQDLYDSETVRDEAPKPAPYAAGIVDY